MYNPLLKVFKCLQKRPGRFSVCFRVKPVVLLVLCSGALFQRSAGNTCHDDLVKAPDTCHLSVMSRNAEELRSNKPDSAIRMARMLNRLSQSDSLWKYKAKALNTIGIAFYYLSEYDSSLFYNQKALWIYEQKGEIIGYADVLINIGNTLFGQGKISSARDFYYRADSIYSKHNQPERTAKAINNLGNTYSKQGNYKKALEYYFKALKIYNKYGNTRGQAGCYNNIGIMYDHLKNSCQALKYYNASMAIYESLNDGYKQISLLNQIGTSLFESGKYDLACSNYEKGLALAQKMNYVSLEGLLENNIGEICLKMSNLKRAVVHFEKACAINKKVKDEVSRAVNLTGLGKALNRQGNHSVALAYLRDAQTIGERLNIAGLLKNVYEEISIALEGKEEMQKALYYYKLFKAMDDSLLNRSNIEKITALNMQYDFDLKQKESEWQQKQKDILIRQQLSEMKTKRIRMLYTSGVLLVTLTSVFLLYSFKQKTKISNLKVEINNNMQRLLGQQMNPHFIFNTLKSIQNFILKNNVKESNLYLTRFSKLIRKILENSQMEFVKLSDELEALELYIKLENLRLNHKFDFNIALTPDIDPEHIKVPSLLFQPFIENSIWHGLAPAGRRGLLQLQLNCENQELRCLITDNGVGRNNVKASSSKQHRSLGSSITEKRIRLINQLYKMNISPVVDDLYNCEGKASGTSVSFSIPVFSEI